MTTKDPNRMYSDGAYAPCALCKTQRPRLELETVNGEGADQPPVEVCRDETWCKARQVRSLEEAQFDAHHETRDAILTPEEARKEGSNE